MQVSRAMLTAIFALPCLASFADHEPNNPERSQRIHPPGADEDLRYQRAYDNEGKPAARDALHGICPKSAAAKRFGDLQLAP